MAIVNRDKDPSDQKEVFSWSSNSLGATTVNTGATFHVGIVPFAGVIQSFRAVAQGLSAAPLANLQILRFAAGGTSIAAGISALVVPAFGISGVMGYSGLAASGSTLLQVFPGDILQVEMSGANTASRSLLVSVVIKKAQDIVSHFGNAL